MSNYKTLGGDRLGAGKQQKKYQKVQEKKQYLA